MEGRYHFFPERGEWMGVVVDGDTVMTVGCEATEAAIREWIAKAMDVEPWIEGNPAVPDMYDRAPH